AGSCIEERHPLPLALALPVFPPQSRVAALGIACSTLPAGMGISATSHQSLGDTLVLDEPAAPFSRRLDKETHWCAIRGISDTKTEHFSLAGGANANDGQD